MLFEQFDLPILKFTSGFVGKSPGFDRFIDCIARYDAFKGVAMMALLWLAWFYRPANEKPGREDERRVQLLITFAGSLAAVLLSRILQRLLDVHQRPGLANLGLTFPMYPDSMPLNSWNSFPSDHAMLFAALATGFWLVNRRLGVIAFVWAFFVVGLPRIYLGFHYPSDLVAGTLFGILVMLGFARLPLRTSAARLLAWSKAHPGLFYCAAFFATDQTAHLFDDVRGIASLLLKYFTGK